MRLSAMKTTLALLVSTLSMISVLAQNPPDGARTNDSPRRDSNALVSPEVHPDRSVTFRLRAPNAKEVKVSGEWPGGAMSLTNNDGLWSITLPLEPDIYGYNFTVDGLAIPDPANPWVKPMRAARTSVVEIPGDPPRLWEFQQVPHGTVHQHTYF